MSTIPMGEAKRCDVLYDQRGGVEGTLRMCFHVIESKSKGGKRSMQKPSSIVQWGGSDDNPYSIRNLRNLSCGGKFVLWQSSHSQGFLG